MKNPPVTVKTSYCYGSYSQYRQRICRKYPTLLPVLKEAGVVDAGGQDLYHSGRRPAYLKGETEQMQFKKPRLSPAASVDAPAPEMMPLMNSLRYCTELMLKGEDMDRKN